MKKELLWTSVVASVVGVVNLIIYTVLAVLNIVELKYLSFLFVLGYIVCAWVPFLLNLIFKKNFSLSVSISYQVFLILALLVGSLWRVYGLWAPYDKIVHFGSGILIALIGYALFIDCKKNHVSSFWLFVICFSIAMMSGAVWEIWEFTTDAIFNNNAQIWQGLVGREALMDTMLDIVCDFVGGIIGGIVAVILSKNSHLNKIELQKEEQKQVSEKDL